ncbi:hypothetical protein BS639_03475 [Rouxiella silvae]|uniref:Uncharacterized protein n=1 Tax=Rouxiella silvae TaxID=1646373 RepID=A0ABX3U593_9GAMM|nr:hypothetical protein ASE93_21970 [Serratia sp. Leaf50]ORJ22656.1 hypothetical protein BS639_03475 [Rouxiella silvae]
MCPFSLVVTGVDNALKHKGKHWVKVTDMFQTRFRSDSQRQWGSLTTTLAGTNIRALAVSNEDGLSGNC